jgi:4-amino-4-deoxy-L-arabinose transferase-like glycosyltransferase
VTLWYHGNAYNHEVAVIPLILAAQWQALRILKGQDSVGQCGALALLLAAAAATDWLGVLVAACIAVALLIYWPTSLTKKWLMIVCIGLSVIGVVAGFTYGYSRLIGWPALQYFYTSSFSRRSALYTDNYHWGHWMAYAAVGAGLMALPALLAVWQKRQQWRWPGTLPTVVIMAIPALLHTLLLSSFSQEHDYALLKWMPLISLLAAAGCLHLSRRRLILSGVALCHIAVYFLINPPAISHQRSLYYSRFARMGQAVQQQVPADAVLMVIPDHYYHQLEWYADRHYWPMPDSATAVSMARMYGLSKVWLLTPDLQHGNPRLTAISR